jgi:hypothetical protein
MANERSQTSTCRMTPRDPLRRVPELEAWRARILREKPALLEPRPPRPVAGAAPEPTLFELEPLRLTRQTVRERLVDRELGRRERLRADRARDAVHGPGLTGDDAPDQGATAKR